MRGGSGAASDVDLLVDFAPGRGLFDDVAGVTMLAEDLLDRRVDLVKRHLVRPELRETILEGAQVDAAI